MGSAVNGGGRRVLLLLLAIAVVGAAVLHLGVARQPPGLLATVEALLALLGGNEVAPVDRVLVVDIRLPRLLTGLFGGAALAVAGTVMQAAFRNPLASPDVVGTAAGAAFGGALAIVIGLASRTVVAVPAASLIAATFVTWMVFALAGRASQFSTTGLLLAGVALNTLVGAMTTFVVSFSFADYAASSEVMFWLMGGLERATWEHAWITAGGAMLFFALVAARTRDLDLLTLRDDSSFSLGLDAPQARRWLLWFACGLTATTVANTGGIAFVGLVVPHVARLLVGPAHRRLLPVAALLGAFLLLVADLLCRNAPLAWNLRLGVITSALGAPYFLYLLARHRRGESLR